MKRVNLLIIACVFALIGCMNENQVQSIKIPDREIIEKLINNSIIKKDDLNKYIKAGNDDEKVITMIIDFNDKDHPNKDSFSKIDEIKAKDMKKRLLILSENIK
jgi:hypothetical protein